MSVRMSAFGTMLRQFREAAGMSQELLAERAGLSLRGVSDLERGARTTPRLETVRMLADGLGLDEHDRAALLAARNASSGMTPPSTRGTVHLPIPSTSFIGRRSEIAMISDLLGEGGARLVTLIGPGGVGKTRLSVEVARHLGDAFPGGVVFVGLASVKDPALVLPTIAAELGSPDTGSSGLLDLLASTMRGRTTLLLLDNFEQVIAAAPDIAALLVRCPSLSVLVTSRVRLHVMAEIVVPIAPLGLPQETHSRSAEILAQADAVTMFVDRARAVNPGFALTPENIDVVVALVSRLDGLPLAIELAAARTRILSPDALLARMDRQLPLLTGGGRDVPERQQTMRNAIAWSYDLLSPTEQRIFRRLSIFPAGCTLDAAEKVLAAIDGLDGMEILDRLTALVDSSLLRRRQQDGEMPRFVMLATVREFGLEALAEHGEEEATHEAAYRAWYVALASTAEPWKEPRGLAARLDLLESEHDNLRGTLSWLTDHDRIDEALDLSGSLWFFRWIRGHYSETRDQFEGLLRHPLGAAPTRARAKALVGLGVIAMHQGDGERALEALREAQEILRESGDLQYLSMATLCYGTAYLTMGRMDESERFIEEAHSIALEIGDKVMEASTLTNLHIIAAYRGQEDKARALLDKQVQLVRSVGETWGLSLGLLNLAHHALQDGDLDRAEVHAEESLRLILQLKDKRDLPGVYSLLAEIARQRGYLERARSMLEAAHEVARDMGDIFTLARSLWQRGRLSLSEEDFDSAMQLTREAARLLQDIGDDVTAFGYLDDVSNIALAAGDPAHAAWCVGAADRSYDDHGITRMDSSPDEHRRRVDTLIKALGEPGWRTHREAGYGHDAETALETCLAWDPSQAADVIQYDHEMPGSVVDR